MPLTVLRSLDCVLEPTMEKVLAKAAELKGGKVANAEPILNRFAKASLGVGSSYGHRTKICGPRSNYNIMTNGLRSQKAVQQIVVRWKTHFTSGRGLILTAIDNAER